MREKLPYLIEDVSFVCSSASEIQSHVSTMVRRDGEAIGPPLRRAREQLETTRRCLDMVEERLDEIEEAYEDDS